MEDVRTAVPVSSGVVTRGMTVMINRMLAGYIVLALLPSLHYLIEQLPGTAAWWLVLVGLPMAATMVAMLVNAFAGRSISGLAAAFAALVLVGTAAGYWGFPDASTNSQPWIWWLLGTAVVCAGVWRGLWVAAGYAAVLAGTFALLRPTPPFGLASVQTAVSESLFLLLAPMAVVGIAVGLLRAARASDAYAERVYRRRVAEAVDAAVVAERARVDRLIHDDVMTTLTSAASAADPATVDAVRALSQDTLVRIDGLQTEWATDGTVAAGAFALLAQEAATRVSPTVSFTCDIPSDLAALPLPIGTVRAILGAMREGVRNAVRHAHASRIEVSARIVPNGTGDALVVVEVADDGVGFDSSQTPADRFGLRLSIAEQLAGVGVDVDLDSRTGVGTRITMSTVASVAPALRARRHRREGADRSCWSGVPAAGRLSRTRTEHHRLAGARLRAGHRRGQPRPGEWRVAGDRSHGHHDRRHRTGSAPGNAPCDCGLDTPRGRRC